MAIKLPTRPGSRIDPTRIVGHVADGELLKGFLVRRDESAFDGLIRRFGPLVMSTAMRILRDRHAAEDVFQATFFVLARDAGRIRRPDQAAAWLHQVAARISRKALRRRRRESSWTGQDPPSEERVLEDLHRTFLFQLLDDELARLPESCRGPVILHYLEGKTCEETAQALGTSLGAVRGRLQRGIKELRLRFARRGVEFLAIVGVMSAQDAVAAVTRDLTQVTVAGGLAMARGVPFHPECSPEAIHLSIKETVMLTTGKVVGVLAVLAACGSLGFRMGASAAERRQDQVEPIGIQTLADSGGLGDRLPAAISVLADAGSSKENAPPAAARAPLTLKYDDGKPDGKKSIAGSGQMIRFELPEKTQQLRGLRIHCARYGAPQPPNEEAEISIVSDDGTDIVHTEMVPYAKFKRGESQWTTITFEDPVEVPEAFWIVLQFNAEQTKGVYVSYDSGTGGEHSKTGVPGGESKPVTFGGDWMVQALLTKPEVDDAAPPVLKR